MKYSYVEGNLVDRDIRIMCYVMISGANEVMDEIRFEIFTEAGSTVITTEGKKAPK